MLVGTNQASWQVQRDKDRSGLFAWIKEKGGGVCARVCGGGDNYGTARHGSVSYFWVRLSCLIYLWHHLVDRIRILGWLDDVLCRSMPVLVVVDKSVGRCN